MDNTTPQTIPEILQTPQEEPSKAIKISAVIGFSFLFYCLLFVIVYTVGVVTKGESDIVFVSLYTVLMAFVSLFAGICLIYRIDKKNYIINKIKKFL